MKKGMKANVQIEQKMCLVCGHEYETGSILMRKRWLKNPSDERFCITGYGECPDCKEYLDRGYVALIVVKNEGCENRIRIENADRTGEVLFLKIDLAKHVFVGVEFADDVNIGVKGTRILLIDTKGAEKLKSQIRKAQDHSDKK